MLIRLVICSSICISVFASTSEPKGPMNETMSNLHLMLLHPRLTQNMLDLLQSMDSHRNKRQYYLYQQSPIVRQQQILGEIVNPVSPLTYQVEPAIESQFANSPQYILVPSRDLIPPQMVEPLTPIPLAPNTFPSLFTFHRLMETLSTTTLPPAPVELNQMINMAAQSALQSGAGLYFRPPKTNPINERSSNSNAMGFPSHQNVYNKDLPLTPSSVNVSIPSAPANQKVFAETSSTGKVENSMNNTGKPMVPLEKGQRSVDEMMMCDSVGKQGKRPNQTISGSNNPVTPNVPAPLYWNVANNNMNWNAPNNDFNVKIARYENSNECSNNEVCEVIHEEIKKMKAGKYNGRKEGLPCPLLGSWISKTAGVIFNINKEDSVEFPVSIQRSTEQKGFFDTCDWEVTAQMPFCKINLLVLTAVHQEQVRMATFTGECRICKGKELVTGHWLITRDECSCADMTVGQEFIGDIWERQK